jgi:hypothetical protein
LTNSNANARPTASNNNMAVPADTDSPKRCKQAPVSYSNGLNCDAQKDMGLMLTGNDKLPNPPAEQFEKEQWKKTRFAWFERLFLRFGAGAYLLEPLIKSRYWNVFCWTLITLGIIGWIILFWILPPFSE